MPAIGSNRPSATARARAHSPQDTHRSTNRTATPLNALAAAATLAFLLVLAGCNRDKQPGRDAGGFAFSDGDTIVLHADGHPVATLTGDGDLLIDGRPVRLDASQHQRLLAYRAQLKEIARQGIGIGKQGADLGVHAAGEALKGGFDGAPERIGERIEAQADKVRQEALNICGHLVALRAAQDALAKEVPAFAPYADIDDKVIADCRA